MVHGAMNSATNPLAYSLVSDYIPPERRATANSILSTAIYSGISLSSLSILLVKNYGWRNSLSFLGLVGVALGALIIMFI